MVKIASIAELRDFIEDNLTTEDIRYKTTIGIRLSMAFKNRVTDWLGNNWKTTIEPGLLSNLNKYKIGILNEHGMYEFEKKSEQESEQESEPHFLNSIKDEEYEFVDFVTKYILNILNVATHSKKHLLTQFKEIYNDEKYIKAGIFDWEGPGSEEVDKVIERTVNAYLNDMRIGNLWDHQKQYIFEDFFRTPNMLKKRISSIVTRLGNSKNPSKSRVAADILELITDLTS